MRYEIQPSVLNQIELFLSHVYLKNKEKPIIKVKGRKAKPLWNTIHVKEVEKHGAFYNVEARVGLSALRGQTRYVADATITIKIKDGTLAGAKLTPEDAGCLHITRILVTMRGKRKTREAQVQASGTGRALGRKIKDRFNEIARGKDAWLSYNT